MRKMGELLSHLLWGQLQSMGFFTEKNVVLEHVGKKAGCIDLYDRWLEESMEVLTRNGYLAHSGTSYTVLDMAPVDLQVLWQEWDATKASWLEEPAMKPQLFLVESTIRALPEILTGKVPATAIMFPDSSMELVEGIYKNNKAADYFNTVLADTVAIYIGERLKQDSSAQIRLLEIGAGTGGTSALVFPKLKPYEKHIQEYAYTDISRAFLIHAKKEYGSHNPYLTYKLFNVEVSAAQQGIQTNAYDILIATNILHATKNIRQTLRNAKAVLKKNGVVFLHELSANTLFSHLTFGLLEGWWLYEDAELRIPGCPLIAPATWQDVLESEGFRSVFFPAEEALEMGHQVIVAESDGVVRQASGSKADQKTAGSRIQAASFQNQASSQKPQVHSKKEEVDENELHERSIDYFKKLVGETLQVPLHEIDASQPLEAYGIDSILIGQLNKVLREVFGDISSTLFFEYQTIGALTDYFLATQKDSMVRLVSLDTGEEQEYGEKVPSGSEQSIAPSSAQPTQSIKVTERVPQNSVSGRQSAESGTSREPIAIIGMSGRFADAKNLEEFWRNLESGKDCVVEIPEDRWPIKGFYQPDKMEALTKGKSYSKWGGFVEGFSEFDPLFFNISPAEAISMDPQERWFIEACWEACEDAGYTRRRLASQHKGRVGVFAGVNKADYSLFGPELWEQGNRNYPHTSFGSVANRISYILDIHGPCMPIDTMCSSSLTALHEACEHLYRGECDMAITGGVNLQLHPLSYYTLCANGMLSPDGRCKSFGKGANGFVPGEGVGVILLKRLSRAIADQDHIYAVIRGTSVNHGGKTNGYMVPNPVAQRDLIREVLDKAGIHARTVSYIEAHGSGTDLGDPIEITGLTQAFQKDTQDTQFCAVGSVKSNIGHLEAASGIAGVIKVVLGIQHGKLVPSLHSGELNPNIQFERTPFVVQQELAEWKRPKVELDEEIREYPRIAGVSSFGAGGSNAHVLIEEYISTDTRPPYPPVTGYNPAIIVISARNEERLMEQVQRLLAVIHTKKFSDVDLPGIAYTLQVGREAMEERLALLARSVQELEEKLKGFVKGVADMEEVYRGQVKRNKDILATLIADGDIFKTIDEWVAKKKYGKLLDFWVKGLNFDWNTLYGDVKPGCISLPTYPFAREEYWIPEIDSKQGYPAGVAGSIPVHPLLHCNTSDFSEQRFSSTFTGQEFFLADHVVNGQSVLPGVVQLEMARAAVEQALGELKEGRTGIRLKDVVWGRPIIKGEEPLQIHIGLSPEDDGEIAYKIYNKPGNQETEPAVHSQGRVELHPAPKAQRLDIQALKAECDRGVISSQQCYDFYKAIGIAYGLGHRGIEAVYAGPGYALAKLSLPASVANLRKHFILHPSMLDSALQAAIGLMIESGGDINPAQLKPMLPFALRELEIHGECTPAMWSLVRFSEDDQADDRIQKLDIDLCDEQGQVCVRMKGFSSRALKGDAQAPGVPDAASPETFNGFQEGVVLLTPVWDPVEMGKNPISPAAQEQVVIVGGTNDCGSAIRQCCPGAKELKLQPGDSIDAIVKKLKKCGLIEHIVWITPYHPLKSISDDAMIEEQNQGALLLLRTIKSLLRLGYDTRDLGWSVITRQTQHIRKNELSIPTHASVHGLVGSMAKEYSNWKIRLVDLEAEEDWPMTDIFGLPADPQGDALARRSGEWYRQKLVPVKCTQPKRTLYRHGGVYVVIGGAGGIGETWSEYVIRTYQAQVVWIGRREMDAAIHAKLDRLAAFGPAPYYIAADATDRKALQKAYDEIKQRYMRIHGVVHSAIALSDQSLSNMDEQRFRVGLSAKIDVSVQMAGIFEKELLDFVLFFSSMQVYTKSAGQSNYASGCTFKDAFAQQLAAEWPCVVKVINWGYWGNVGIVASKVYQERMAQDGIGSIEAPEAMETLEMLLAGPVDRIALMKTIKPLPVGTNEFIEIYRENIPPIVKSIQDKIPQQNLQIAEVKPEFDQQTKELDALLGKLLWCQLKSIGLFPETDVNAAENKAKTGVIAVYGRWLEESIAVLERMQYLQRVDGSLAATGVAPQDTESAWKEWERQKEVWLENPSIKSQVLLVEAMLRALPEILTGRRPATEVMFAGSSLEMVEGVYKNNLVLKYYNEVLANTLSAYIQERIAQDPSARIRILEVGAGTGGTSVGVFPRLQPYLENIQEYCYTDISRVFLINAEKEYGSRNPYLTYKILDVEKPMQEQEIDVGGYDIVIAANVLHATRNILKVLRNVKAALQSNGLLLLNEICSNTLFAHLTFGLMEGWWLYEDSALRIPGCPALYPETMQAVLEGEGFHSVFFPAREAHALGQQIVAAESDGVVRQERLFKPAAAPMKKNILYQGMKRPAEQRLPVVQAGTVTQEVLKEKSIAYIKKLVSETLKVPYNKIDSSEPLERYGIDSILVIQMTNVLRKVLANVNSTLLFEYQTIDELVEYFLKTQKDALMKLVGIEEQAPKQEAFAEVIQEFPRLTNTASRRFVQLGCKEAEKSEPGRFGVMDVAIIGVSGRYPQAENIREFWNNLVEGKNCIVEIPEDRWDWKKYYGADKGKWGTIYTKWGGFIKDIDKFDASFFQISPEEAESIDPQERLFLETAYASIEDAGYMPANLCRNRKVGVFVGVMNGKYFMGETFWSIANRVSYLFNFQGPSMAVDTACSASLIAVHLALESLYSGTSECAIAGGVNLILNPLQYMGLSFKAMLSPGNACKSFGDGADGFVDGEGVGALVLKPLKNAVADGDHIYGVIKGSMINAGGKTNGYTVPNPQAQAHLVAEALQRAQVHPRTISYVEAHGTGTALGDPIEIAGLKRAFHQDTQDSQFCSLGSVKSNIGHCESVGGIAGVTKVLLQMQNRQLVPSLHSKVLNLNIDFSSTPFRVQQELAEWKRPIVELNGEKKEYPRRAGVSSFGAAGSNAHIILEEYTEQAPATFPILIDEYNPAIIILSAKNQERLRERAQRLLADIRKQSFSDRDLVHIAYTLQVGRETMEERLAMTASSIQELERKLQSFLAGQEGGENFHQGRLQDNKETLAIFAADEELHEAVEKWIQRKKYAKFLEIWVKGLDFEWNKLYEAAKPHRVSLSTYPFARERYWLQAKGNDAEKGKNMQFNEAAFALLFHEISNNAISMEAAMQKVKKCFDMK